MGNFAYFDYENIRIEGRRFGAHFELHGVPPSYRPQTETDSSDLAQLRHLYKVDIRALREIAGGPEPKKAVLFASRRPTDESSWGFAERAGYELNLRDRNGRNREKGVDTSISLTILSDSLTFMDPDRDEITLVSGDADFATLPEFLPSGLPFHVLSWNHAAAEKLKSVATTFTALDKWWTTLVYRG